MPNKSSELKKCQMNIDMIIIVVSFPCHQGAIGQRDGIFPLAMSVLPNVTGK